jgi:hypothetical protein
MMVNQIRAKNGIPYDSLSYENALSHGRPMHEVIGPTRKDIHQDFERNFEGMTDQPVTPEELLEAREALIREIIGKMPDDHRRFLISFERGEPDWPLLGLEHVPDLPAIQ